MRQPRGKGMWFSMSMDNRKPSFWAGSWYFLVTIVSAGLLAWVPFTHAAGRLHRRSIAALAVLYAALAVTAMARRATARKLVADDPLIARELRIGRPELPGDYDDGGLVDLNNAPAAMIATACELTPQTADGIVAARAECGGFLTVEDLFSMADIPIGAWDMVRDRGVVIPPTA